jgi:hypothetical protein
MAKTKDMLVPVLLALAALVFTAACSQAVPDAEAAELSSAIISAAASTGTLPCTPNDDQAAACSGRAAGDACTLPARGDAGTGPAGTCRATVDGSSVGCVPNPPAPPQGAVDACSGKAAGEACTFTDRHGDADDGACLTPPGQSVLACAPVRTPPAEAVTACSGKAAGDACTLPARDDGHTPPAGACGLGPAGAGPLACAPPHGLGADAAAACTGLATGAACTMASPHGSATGTCVAPSAGGSDVCLVACGALGPGPGGPHGHGGPGGPGGVGPPPHH